MADSFGALIYLYNGGDQPEIRSVTSEKEVLVCTEQFNRVRVEIPGQPPVWLKSRKKALPPTTNSSWDPPYDWRRARNHMQGDGDASISFAFSPDNLD